MLPPSANLTEIITTISMVDDGLVVFRNKSFNGALRKDINHFGGSACDGQLNQRPLSISWSICSIECGEIPSSRNPGISGIDALSIRISST
jgi:hypothetical protein